MRRSILMKAPLLQNNPLESTDLIYAALDLHCAHSVLGSMEAGGRWRGTQRFATSAEALQTQVAALGGPRVWLTLEASATPRPRTPVRGRELSGQLCGRGRGVGRASWQRSCRDKCVPELQFGDEREEPFTRHPPRTLPAAPCGALPTSRARGQNGALHGLAKGDPALRRPRRGPSARRTSAPDPPQEPQQVTFWKLEIRKGARTGTGRLSLRTGSAPPVHPGLFCPRSQTPLPSFPNSIWERTLEGNSASQAGVSARWPHPHRLHSR